MRTLKTLFRQHSPVAVTYEIRDLLHEGRTAWVPADGIAATVTSWLSDVGAVSPSVHQLAGAIRAGDWPVAHAIAESLSVDVSPCLADSDIR